MTGSPPLYPWLEPTHRRLLGRLASDRMPHALLLTGPSGVGKQALAGALAAAALCTQPASDGRPCGSCQSCRLQQAGTHPDFTFLTIPEDKTQILVDQIRELAQTLSLSRSVGAHRVAIIWPADAMNQNAANSLLKTLEEPPERTLVILVTAEPSRLPATIRSRCQISAVPLPDEAETRTWLTEQGVDAKDMDTLLCLSRGAPLTALASAGAEAVKQWRALLEDMARVATGERGVVATAERWKGEQAERVIHWIQIALWEATRGVMSGQAGGAHTKDLQPLVKALDWERTFPLQDRLTEWRRLARTTINPQMLLEEVFAGLAPDRP